MNYRTCNFLTLLPVLSLILITFSCHSSSKQVDKDTVATPALMDAHVGSDIKSLLQYASDNKDRLNDTIFLGYRHLLDSIYGNNNYAPIWSDKEHFLSDGDSLLGFIANSKDYGLFPTDYHYSSLSFIHRILQEDTMARKSAALWSKADIMLTDAFFTLVKHLKQGRLDYDSVTLRKDSILPDSFYTRTLASAIQGHS